MHSEDAEIYCLCKGGVAFMVKEGIAWQTAVLTTQNNEDEDPIVQLSEDEDELLTNKLAIEDNTD